MAGLAAPGAAMMRAPGRARGRGRGRVARTILRVAIWALAAAGALGLAAHRRGWAALPPSALATVAGALLASLAAELALTLLERRPPGHRLRHAGRALALSGAVAMGAGGLANWLLSLQGFAVLLEREAVPLFRGSHLQGFEAGPLADPAELDVVVQLAALELHPAGDGAFAPESRVLVSTGGAAPQPLTLGPDAEALGALRLSQGAFGFAPRLVVLKDGATLLDRTVMFETRRTGPGTLAFEGEVELPERVQLLGAVSLAGLDERMRGHPQLAVRLVQAGRVLGAGELSPGHFADVEGGYRIGLAGLWRWVEIDVSRRNYRLPVLVGAAALLAGLALWAVAAWRRA